MTSRHALLFAVCAAVFIIAAMPLAALTALIDFERLGIAVGRTEGTVWQGRLKHVYWRNYAMGEFDVRPSFLALLKGQVSVDVAVNDGPVQAKGTVARNIFSDVIVRDAVVSADINGLPVLLQLSGQIDADVGYVEYGRGGCVDVNAVLETDALVHGFAGLAWTGPVLTGEMRCEDGVLVLPLNGAENGQNVALQMTLKPDRTFDIRISIQTLDAALAQVLPALGFRREDNALVLVQSGRWG